MTRAIDVVIETLVLDGFNPPDRDAIASAAIAELATLLERGEASLRGMDLPKVAAPPLQLSPRMGPQHIGRGIAHAVHAAVQTARPIEGGR